MVSTISTKEKKTGGRRKAKSASACSLHEEIIKFLDESKTEDIVCIDLKGKASFADFMIVASGRSSRQVSATAQKLKDRLKEKHRIKAAVEGTETGDWVIVDAGDVIVHLFRPEVRSFYSLEKLWSTDFSAVDYTLYTSK